MLQGSQIMGKALAQETELKRAQIELAERKREEGRIQNILESQENQQRTVEDKFASKEEQVAKMTVKLGKLWEKYKAARQEIADVQAEFQREKEEFLETIRDLQRDINFRTRVAEAFIPATEVAHAEECAEWNEDDGLWTFRLPATRQRPKRPASACGFARPTTDFARINRAMGDPQPRFRYDGILQTDVDFHEPVTIPDFDAQSPLPPHLRGAVDTALAEDAKADKTRRPPTATQRPEEHAYPEARGLVAR